MNKTENDLSVEVGGSGEVTVMDPSTGEVGKIIAPHTMPLGALRSLLIIQ